MALYYRLRRRKFLFLIVLPLLILTISIYTFSQITPVFINLSEDKIYALTFKITNELAQCGINTSEIADLCYTNKPKNLILFQSELISNAKFCLNDKIAYTLITKEILEKYRAKDEYTEGICETLRSIAGVEAAFVLKEMENDTKVSIRTKEIDATKIAQKFNGGGHKRAAGCTIKSKINQALEKLLREAKTLL